jgi:hypothetical protein
MSHSDVNVPSAQPDGTFTCLPPVHDLGIWSRTSIDCVSQSPDDERGCHATLHALAADSPTWGRERCAH